MILVGQYNSPYVRRVAVSLRVLGFAYERDTRSVFANFDAMREINPLGRIPSLVLDDSEVLIDSALTARSWASPPLPCPSSATRRENPWPGPHPPPLSGSGARFPGSHGP